MKARVLDLSLFDQGYDEQTQLLTTRGWKGFRDLQNDDRAFVWSHGTLDLERVDEVYTRRYEGTMYQFRNRHIDIFCMPGTKIVARVKKHGRADKDPDYTATRAEYIKSSWQLQIPLSGLWAGETQVIPRHAYETGLWCSGVLQRGSPAFDRDTIVLLHKVVEDRDFSGLSEADLPGLTQRMQNINPTGELSWNMLLWALEARKQLVLGLMDGRGRRYPPALVFIFLTTRESRAEIFQALTMSLNWRSMISRSNGVFFAQNKTTSSVYYKHRRVPENWTGDVWNIKTDAGQMVVRRDLKSVIVSTL